VPGLHAERTLTVGYRTTHAVMSCGASRIMRVIEQGSSAGFGEPGDGQVAQVEAPTLAWSSTGP
jgi:hypothetical protein